MASTDDLLFVDGEVRNIRDIQSPVSDVSCSVILSPPLRLNRCLDYIKTDKRWLIELRFNSNYEIALFERFIIGTPIRFVEYQGRYDRSPRYFYIDSRIPNSATREIVVRWMREQLPCISAAMAIHFPRFLPPTIRCIVDVAEALKGKGPWCESEMALIHGTSSTPIIRRLLEDGTDLISPYLAMCAADGNFREAAMYCGQALGFRGGNPWMALYRAFEVVCDNFGGDAGVVECLSCVSKKQIDRFTRTINHQEAIGQFSRHARSKAVPPPEPMSFEEAVEFVLVLLRAWQNRSGGNDSN